MKCRMCWIRLKCSAEPKTPFLAQLFYEQKNPEPPWRKTVNSVCIRNYGKTVRTSNHRNCPRTLTGRSTPVRGCSEHRIWPYQIHRPQRIRLRTSPRGMLPLNRFDGSANRLYDGSGICVFGCRKGGLNAAEE